MRPISRVAFIAAKLQAIANCIAAGNAEWRDRHQEALDATMEGAPSGSGFDNGSSLFDKSTPDKLVFGTAYHHMDGSGMYDGWTDHTVVVTPAFDGFDLKVTGRDRNDIKDHIAEVFHAWLAAAVHPGTGTEVADGMDEALTNGARVLLASRTPAGMLTADGRFILCQRDDAHQPFVVWWQRTSDQSLHQGDYCATIGEAAEAFARRVAKG